MKQWRSSSAFAALAAACLLAAPARAQDAPPKEGAPPEKSSQPQEEKKPADAQDPDKQVEWTASYAEAVRLARDAKKPIFVAFNRDGAGASDSFADSLYRDKKFVEKSRQFLCVICSSSKHEERAGAAGSSECKRFGRVSCAEHKACEAEAIAALIGGGDPLEPQHVVVMSDGRVLARRAWTLKIDELTHFLDAALKMAAGPSDPKAERTRIDDLIHEAEKAGAWRAGDYVRKIADLETETARAALFDYATKGRDDETRVAIAVLLGKRGDYTGLEPLKSMAKDRKGYVALAGVDAIGRTRLPDAKEDLKKLLNKFTAGNDFGRILRALAWCGRDDKNVLEIVMKHAKGTDQNVRAHAIVALSSFDSCAEIDDLLKKVLNDRITVVRAAAAYAVGVGRHKNCAKELGELAHAESVQDLKELASTALSHLDHDPDDPKCCDIEGKIYTFLPLGDTRR